MDCPICYETVPEDDRKVLKCNHSLCCGCLSKLRANTCPFCRAPIDRDGVQLDDDRDYDVQLDDDREFEDEIVEVYLPIIQHYGAHVRNRRRLRRRQTRRRRRRETAVPTPSLVISEAEIEDITSTPATRERSVWGVIKPGHIPDRRKQQYRNARNRWKKNKHKIASEIN